MCNEQHVHVAISDGADGADGADGIGGGRSLNQVLHDGAQCCKVLIAHFLLALGMRPKFFPSLRNKDPT